MFEIRDDKMFFGKSKRDQQFEILDGRLIDVQGKLVKAADALKVIINFSRKVEKFMATQEERLQAIFGQLTEVKGGINTLQQQLADLKANNPDIEDEIAAIEGTVTEIRDGLPGVPPAEPAPEG